MFFLCISSCFYFNSFFGSPPNHRLFFLPECGAITRCEAREQYALQVATASADSVCANLTRCTASEYELVVPTGSSNRECADLRSCSASEYELQPPILQGSQYISNRLCAPITVCNATQYLARPASETADAVCLSLQQCGLQLGTFQSRAPTPTSNRVCQNLTQCYSGEVELRAATFTSDRACDVPNTVRSQVRITKYTPSNFSSSLLQDFQAAAAAVARRAMVGSSYQPGAGNVTVTNVYAGSVVLEFTVAVPSFFAADVFAALQNFDAWLVELLKINAGAFTGVQVTDIVCAKSQYAVTLPIGFGLKGCVNGTQCGLDQFEFAPLTATSNRVCQQLSQCNTSTEYQWQAPTATSDRQCRTVSECTPNTFESQPATPTSNRQCLAVRQCATNEFEAAPPTPVSNR